MEKLYLRYQLNAQQMNRMYNNGMQPTPSSAVFQMKLVG
jgi:hypothetical protein